MPGTTVSHSAQRDELLAATTTFFTAGVMSHSGHANLSARVGDREILLSSSGQVRELTEDDFAVVSLDGSVIEGNLAPTNAEIVEMTLGSTALGPSSAP